MTVWTTWRSTFERRPYALWGRHSYPLHWPETWVMILPPKSSCFLPFSYIFSSLNLFVNLAQFRVYKLFILSGLSHWVWYVLKAGFYQKLDLLWQDFHQFSFCLSSLINPTLKSCEWRLFSIWDLNLRLAFNYLTQLKKRLLELLIACAVIVSAWTTDPTDCKQKLAFCHMVYCQAVYSRTEKNWL